MDYQPAVAQRAGIGRYAKMLAAELSKQLSADDSLRLFYCDFRRRAAVPKLPRVSPAPFHALPGAVMQKMWHHLRFPPFNWVAGSADVYHFTNFTTRPLTAGKAVVSIHDMSFARFPQFAERRNLRHLRSGIQRSAKTADAIITISEFSKREIEDLLPAARGKVHVTYLGIGSEFGIATADAVAAIRAKIGVERPFMLTVGTVEPRKNLEFLVDVFERVAPRGVDLVVAGAPGWKCDATSAVSRTPGSASSSTTCGSFRTDAAPLYSAASSSSSPPTTRLRLRTARGHGLRHARAVLVGRLAARGARHRRLRGRGLQCADLGRAGARDPLRREHARAPDRGRHPARLRLHLAAYRLRHARRLSEGVRLMRAVFDSRWIYERPSGIGVYAREMMARLPRLLPEIDFVFLFSDGALEQRHMAPLAGLRNVQPLRFARGPLSPGSQLRLPALLRELRPALFHTPNYMMPFLAFPDLPGRAVKCIVNIHDVIPLVVEGYAPSSRTSRFRGVFRFCLAQSVRRADAVITGSDASRRDMIAALALGTREAAKIQVVYDGAGGRLGELAHDPVKTDPATPRMLLYVGRMDPYKTSMACRGLCQARRRVAFRAPVVWSRRRPLPGGASSRSASACRRRRLRLVPDEELPRLYASADLLVHPSRYEGFGLQLVEAMKCGLPVCCTDGGSQPEIAGDAAVVVKAADSLAMAEAIADILGCPAKQERMKAAGLARARNFGWDVCAERTADLYRTLVKP